MPNRSSKCGIKKLMGYSAPRPVKPVLLTALQKWSATMARLNLSESILASGHFQTDWLYPNVGPLVALWEERPCYNTSVPVQSSLLDNDHREFISAWCALGCASRQHLISGMECKTTSPFSSPSLLLHARADICFEPE